MLKREKVMMGSLAKPLPGVLMVTTPLLVTTLLVACSASYRVGENGRQVSDDAGDRTLSYDECGNGMDDDVDGRIDEGCVCSAGEHQNCFSGVYPNRLIGGCADGLQRCNGAGSDEFGSWGACEGDVLPNTESCADGADQDCDGAIDEGCECASSEPRACGFGNATGACAEGMQRCEAGVWTGCEGAIGPGAELCSDEIDNDCDGLVNEGCQCIPAPEVCHDGVDNDCDGEVDDAACHSSSRLVSIAVGFAHACALDELGTVYCWGDNRFGQLGRAASEEPQLLPAEVSGLPEIVQIDTEHFVTCARDIEGNVYCWGFNGLLADGTTDFRPEPVAIVGVDDAIALSVGLDHACAVRASGFVVCWGGSFDGDTSPGGRFVTAVPVDIGTPAGAIDVVAGNGHTCLLAGAGTVYCWGDNQYGQINNQSVDRIDSPVPIARSIGAMGVADVIAAGTLGAGYFHTCAGNGAQMDCWGRNLFGELAFERTDLVHTGMLPDSIVQLDGGFSHMCARLNMGRVVCWAHNALGQIDPQDSNISLPMQDVEAAFGAIDLSASAGTTCAVLGDGGALCWGRNSSGEHGNGTRGEDASLFGYGRVFGF